MYLFLGAVLNINLILKTISQISKPKPKATGLERGRGRDRIQKRGVHVP